MQELNIGYTIKGSKGKGISGAEVFEVETEDGKQIAVRTTKDSLATYRQGNEFLFVDSLSDAGLAEAYTSHLLLPMGYAVHEKGSEAEHLDIIYPLMQSDMYAYVLDSPEGDQLSEHSYIGRGDFINFVSDMAQAVDFMHAAGFVHRDLDKIRNYLTDGQSFFLADMHLVTRINKPDDILKDHSGYIIMLEGLMMQKLRMELMIKKPVLKVLESSNQEFAATFGQPMDDLFRKFETDPAISFVSFTGQILNLLQDN